MSFRGGGSVLAVSLPLDTTRPTAVPSLGPVFVVGSAAEGGAVPRVASRRFQRAQPSPREQQRRVEWAREWSTVGRKWKRQHDFERA